MLLSAITRMNAFIHEKLLFVLSEIDPNRTHNKMEANITKCKNCRHANLVMLFVMLVIMVEATRQLVAPR